MAHTNFGLLQPLAKVAWSRKTWMQARDMMFISKFLGTENSMIHHVTELTKQEKGDACIVNLVADLVEDGVVGDNEREGNEEAMNAYWQRINIDLLSHGIKNKGKMADQKTVVDFRGNGKDRLAFWLANRVDQMAFLTLSGISYTLKNNGAPRVNSSLNTLAFAADVSAPTAQRGLMWDGTALQPSNNSLVAATYLPTYRMVTNLVGRAKETYMRPIMAGGKEYFVLLVQPGTLVALKNDPVYQTAVVNAGVRGEENPWFKGGTVLVDGVVIHEHNLVYNTKGAAPGGKWGAGGNINGTRSLLCGAQALAMGDIGVPEWDEKTFDYNSKQGINIDKMCGFLKPKFQNIYTNTVEDFGVMTCDHFIA